MPWARTGRPGSSPTAQRWPISGSCSRARSPTSPAFPSCLRPPSTASTPDPRRPSRQATRWRSCRRSPAGEDRSLYLTDSPIDVAALLQEGPSSDGAVCLFVGVVRDSNEGRATTSIRYEAYGPMAETQIGRIVEELSREHPEVRLAVRHRVGELGVGEASVAIAAVSPHRA